MTEAETIYKEIMSQITRELFMTLLPLKIEQGEEKQSAWKRYFIGRQAANEIFEELKLVKTDDPG